MLTLRRALAVAALHGPAELLPISSSGHVTAIPWLLGWEWEEIEPELRKGFEVALHAGTALALLPDEVTDPRGLGVVAVAAAPPAGAGLVLERVIERDAGAPEVIAGGLALGAVAMVLADRSPETRSIEEAALRDGLWLGLAQAAALIPGVSRSGAALAAARWLRFRRADAEALSRRAALPVIGGAALLKGFRLARRPPDAATMRVLAAGAGASFISSLAARSVVERSRAARSLMPYAIYRLLLAGLMTARLRGGARARRPGRARG